jgi:SAM-dependent methyltransferase
MNPRLKSLLEKGHLYHPLQTSYRLALSFLTLRYHRLQYAKYRGSGFVCNFCGAAYTKFVPEYPTPDIAPAINDNHVIAGYGENVYCPHCGSKNRERLIKAVLQTHVETRNKKILHFSPEKNLYRFLKETAAAAAATAEVSAATAAPATATVTTADITPGFYRHIDTGITYADATRLPFADATADIVIANHILEHIPDDLKAIKEIFRVLTPRGVAILQVPYSPTIPHTLEDPAIDDPQQQAKRFGQKDHVRIYALNDYIRRLESAGFQVRLLTPPDLNAFRIHAIQPEEIVFLGYKNRILPSA